MTQTNPLTRFPLTNEQIEQVMLSFYGQIRTHPDLGPVFINHIGDDDGAWDHHIEKIGRFWRSMILREGGYDGNPMVAHSRAHDVLPRHFEPWLALFDKVLAEELPQPAAQAWSMMAHRIGGTLQRQIASLRDQTQ